MAKIGKIRFVNFTYNDNRHIYDQTFDFYNGEDTLLNLQNGGGKTVLVQMMMQPIIPKQRLKDRLFKSYFTNAKAPVYIMIEWILDNSPARVMTGIGIKRVLGKSIEDESDSIKVVTFLSEYEGESPFDIKNIELLEEERGIVRLLEFERVVKNLSNGEKEGQNVWVYRWELPDDRKEYAGRLQGYKINQLEWKNLMVRINEAEAGLNSFFNDCKTNGALVKKWFIPTIEEQLNKNGNLIENIKELVKNHAEQLVKNEDMIREREVFESFKRKSSELVQTLNEYKELLERSEENKEELGNAFVYVNDRLKRLELQKEELNTRKKDIENHIKELQYEKLSEEYHRIDGILQQLHDEAHKADLKTGELEEQARELAYKEKLLLCVRLKDELGNLNAKVAKFETELEKESLQQEDVKKTLQDLEYSLKEKYGQKILQTEKALEDEKQYIEEKGNKLAGYREEYERVKKEILSHQEELIRIRSRIAIGDQAEQSLRAAYAGFEVVKNTHTGEYDTGSITALQNSLAEEEALMEKRLEEAGAKRLEQRSEIELLEKECRKLREEYPAVAIEKSKKGSAYRVFEQEKATMDKIRQAYELGEDCLFKKEKLLDALNADQEKYNKLIHDTGLQNAVLQKQLKQYESGKAFELPEELKKVFEDRNLFVEFGYEWLRSVPENKNAKLRLVKNNPFLPYSLIVSREDLRAIQEMEFKGILSPVIPLIERERLEQALNIRSRNYVHSLETMDFLIAFDDRILNKNYLKEICEEITARLHKNREVIENARNALQNIASDTLKAEAFSYTREDVEGLEEDVKSLERKLEETLLELARKEESIHVLKQSEAENATLENSLKNEKNRFERKKEDIRQFINRCPAHSKDLKERENREEALKNAESIRETLEKEIDGTGRDIGGKNQEITNITRLLEKDRLQYQKYRDVQSGNLINEDIEQLESKLSVFSSEMSGKIQNLRDILEDYKSRRNEKQKQLEVLGIRELLYMGREFNEYELESIRKEEEKISREIRGIAEEKNKVQFKVAERSSDLKYVRRNIEEQCGCDAPKPKEDIRALDFDQEKELLQNRLKELEKEFTMTKKQESQLQRVRFSLEEYSALGAGIVEPRDIQEDLNTYVSARIKKYREFTALEGDQRNMITVLYSDLDGEFTSKAEVFKNLFHAILEGEKRYQPLHALNAFSRAYLQIDRKLEQHSIDMKKIDSMEACIIDNTLSYLKNVYDEMSQIDRNSTIEVEGKRCKMLIIGLPDRENLEAISLREYLKGTIRNCVSLYKEGKSVENLLSNELNTYDLFDRLVGINKIEITLIKVEPNRLKKKTWKQVIAENSGGEKFVSAFVVFISLLTYMRGENLLETAMDSKVLIMDNPFGPITSEHLLKPLFEISKKYNTQMICLTDLKEHTIFDRFNLIYSLNIEREVGREEEYIELKTIKKDIQKEEEEDEILSASMFKIEDKSRFELMN